MELMSQFDATINYLPGDQNCAADALSRLPDPPLSVIAATLPCKVSSRFELEDALIQEIQDGYDTDLFTQKLCHAAPGMPHVKHENGFWFIHDRLVIPERPNLRETLFHLVHDNLGHFSSTKTYGTLRESFYWPNMCRDLEE